MMTDHLIIKNKPFNAALEIGSDAVRTLLAEVLLVLQQTPTFNNSAKLVLDETTFPYKLSHSHLYVAFSHSVLHHTQQGQCAVLLSPYIAQGIDIEINNISTAIAKRYFSDAENIAIAATPLLEQPLLRKRLWQLKEAYIKATHGRIMLNMGQCMISLFGDDIIDLSIKELKTTHWQIKFEVNQLWSVLVFLH